jgi:hypothetical protein
VGGQADVDELGDRSIASTLGAGRWGARPMSTSSAIAVAFQPAAPAAGLTSRAFL